MIIDLSPVRDDGALDVACNGNTALIDGLFYDFGQLGEGDRLPRAAVTCPALRSDVTRQGGQVRLTLHLPLPVDADFALRFPDPIMSDTPGLTGPAGGIDWQQVVTAAASQAAALQAWRASAEMSLADFCMALVFAGILSTADAITAAKGDVPPSFEPVIAAMSTEQQVAVRIRWAAMSSVERLNPLILAVAAGAGIPAVVLDQVFGWT